MLTVNHIIQTYVISIFRFFWFLLIIIEGSTDASLLRFLEMGQLLHKNIKFNGTIHLFIALKFLNIIIIRKTRDFFLAVKVLHKFLQYVFAFNCKSKIYKIA